jgi:hypothetical protein
MLDSGNTEHEKERAYEKPNTSHKIGHYENKSGSPGKQL